MLNFPTYPHLSYFRLLVLSCIVGKEIGRFYKNNRSKLSTPTFKKPILSSSASHISSASNSTRKSISSQLDNKDINKNQIKNNTSNTDGIHSCVTPRGKIDSVQATSITTHLTPLNATLPIAPVELHTTKKLPPTSKENFCFQINIKSSQRLIPHLQPLV